MFPKKTLFAVLFALFFFIMLLGDFVSVSRLFPKSEKREKVEEVTKEFKYQVGGESIPKIISILG